MNCINLCEILPSIAKDYASIDEFLHKIQDMCKVNFPERIYIGSYFCQMNFLHSLALTRWLFPFCDKNSIKVTLVIPVISQGMLEKGLKAIYAFSDSPVVDEFTVNDYGMLAWCSENFALPINLGRIMSKNPRDIRYNELTKSEYKYAPNDFTLSITEKFQLNTIEFDYTNEKMNISVPTGMRAAFHYPFCYMSTGMVCEFASIKKKYSKKFRPNYPCECECSKIYSYTRTANGQTLLKFGRTIYFRINTIKICAEYPRYIFTPFDVIISPEIWRYSLL